MADENVSQSQQVLAICREIQANHQRQRELQAQLRNTLREGFGCGPRMGLDEQLRFLADLFFELNQKE